MKNKSKKRLLVAAILIVALAITIIVFFARSGVPRVVDTPNPPLSSSSGSESTAQSKENSQPREAWVSPVVSEVKELLEKKRELTANWAEKDKTAGVALELSSLYSLWTQEAGAHQRRKVQADRIIRENEKKCTQAWQIIHLQEYRSMLNEPDLVPIVEASMQGGYQSDLSKAIAAQRWRQPNGYNLQPFLPEEIAVNFFANPDKYIEALEVENNWGEVQETLGEDFLNWYRDAIRASIFWGTSKNYLKSQAPDELGLISEKLKRLGN